MASNAELQILLKAKDEASATLKKAGGNFAEFGDIAKKAALGIAVAVAGIAAVSIKAAAEAQKVTAQTDAVLASTKGAAGVTREAVLELSASLSMVIPIEDELIQETQNMLLTFTRIGKDVFPLATETALDMATALGTDSVGASVMLGKALNDPIRGITALTRVGVTFTEEQRNAIKAMVDAGDVMGAQKIILAELSTEFGGSARAAGQTFGGQLAILQTQLGNVQEEIGMALIPILMELLKAVMPAVKAFGEWLPQALASARQWFAENEETISALGEVIGAVASVALPVLGAAFDVISGIIRSFISLLSGAISTIQNVIQLAKDAWAWIGRVTGARSEVAAARRESVNVGAALRGFAHGGIVPGPVGQAQLAVVHGGERVLTPGQQGGITVIFNGPTYGIDDLNERVRSAVVEGIRRGGFSGALAGAS